MLQVEWEKHDKAYISSGRPMIPLQWIEVTSCCFTVVAGVTKFMNVKTMFAWCQTMNFPRDTN